MDQSSPKKGLGFGIVVGVVLIAVAAAVIKYTFLKDEAAFLVETASPSPSISTTVESPEATPVTAGAYKDGSYTATGTYVSPGGSESITVKLTLKNEVVTDATVTGNATVPTSQQYQTQFINGYKAKVIGKNISTLNLDKVSGSSLTPKGFNDAVAKIKVQAEA